MLELLLNDYPDIVIFLAGMLGSFTADVFTDNCVEMPSFKNNKLYLGWIGGAIIGGFAALLIDGAFITAFMAGFIGKDIITRFISNPKNVLNNLDKSQAP